jgi:transcriptional regulator with XRE-family HTH domain
MVRVSREFKARLKLADQPAYKIANRAGVNPTTLSKLINGIELVKPGDERIILVAEVLGLSATEAFEVVPQEAARLQGQGDKPHAKH